MHIGTFFRHIYFFAHDLCVTDACSAPISLALSFFNNISTLSFQFEMTLNQNRLASSCDLETKENKNNEQNLVKINKFIIKRLGYVYYQEQIHNEI